jgi:hypothetical protein
MQALDNLITQASGLAATPVSHLRELAACEPFIAAMLARDGFVSEMLDSYLARYAQSVHRPALGEALTQIHHGRRDPGITSGLDEIETMIATRALDALAGRVTIPRDLWPAMAIAPVLGDIVAAANGDSTAASRARRELRTWADGDSPDSAALAVVLNQILDGDRAPALAAGLSTISNRVIIHAVLQYTGMSR